MKQNKIEGVYSSTLAAWGTVLSSQVLILLLLYLTMPFIFDFDSYSPIVDENIILISIFAIAAILNLILSFYLRKRFMVKAQQGHEVEGVRNAYIVGFALVDTISIFGFMLGIVVEYQYFIVWFIVGCIATLIQFPKKNDFYLAAENNQSH